MKSRVKRQSGFTLAELAIAFFIIGLVLAGALMPLSTQVEVRNIADTRRTMDQIRDALIGFALANGRLPCPANGALASGASGAGSELLSGNACSAVFGVIPWATLGVPETDAWGRRYTYRVAPVFSDSVTGTATWQSATTTTPASPANQTPACAPTPTPTQSSAALCTLGDIVVLTRSVAAKTATPAGSALAAVFISHGRNGYGARQSTGVALSPSPHGDEAANVNGTTTTTSGIAFSQYVLFSRDPTDETSGCVDPAPGTAAGSEPLCEFDDIVTMIPANVLISRLVSAGRLP